MPTTSPAPDVAALIQRIEARLDRITFNKDDGATIHAAFLAARAVVEWELWPYRDSGLAIRACRELWDGVLDGVLAYRDRAGLSDAECDHLRQWEPMPGFGKFHFPELDD